MEIMTWKDKIKKAVGDNKYTKVKLHTADRTSVYHFTGNGEETALKELGSYQTLAELVSMPPFTSRGGCDVMDTLRDESLMAGYYRGTGEFPEHVAQVLSSDWVCSENGWVEVDLDHMDHKRAMATKESPTVLVSWLTS